MYLNTASIIKKKITIGINNKENTNTLNIAYGIDKNFILGCAISITSILANNPISNFSFHIFTNNISYDFEKKLNLLSKQYHTEITLYLVDDKSLSILPTTKYWTIATYFRFIVADYFYKQIDKILYLDADIICKGSLSELFSLKFDNNIAYVVNDKDNIWWNKCAVRLKESKLSKGYFNAGFLLINLNNWHEADINNKALGLLCDNSQSAKLTHLDQDVLNILLLDKVKYLDKKYNQQVSINYELKKKFRVIPYSPINDDTLLIHYIGPTKPWHKWAKNYKCSQYFLNSKDASPWSSMPLLSASSSKQMRYWAKHNWHQGKFIVAMFSFIRYIINKINFQKIFIFRRKKR